MELVKNVPAWLRSLRLHKYTHLFCPEEKSADGTPSTTRKWTWREIVQLSDEDLEKIGVGALGARRKLLKVFELVRSDAEARGLL